METKDGNGFSIKSPCRIAMHTGSAVGSNRSFKIVPLPNRFREVDSCSKNRTQNYEIAEVLAVIVDLRVWTHGNFKEKPG